MPVPRICEDHLKLGHVLTQLIRDTVPSLDVYMEWVDGKIEVVSPAGCPMMAIFVVHCHSLVMNINALLTTILASRLQHDVMESATIDASRGILMVSRKDPEDFTICAPVLLALTHYLGGHLLQQVSSV